MSKIFSKDMGFIGLIESLLLWLMLNIYNAKNWVGGWMPQFDIGWLCPHPLNQLSAAPTKCRAEKLAKLSEL